MSLPLKSSVISNFKGYVAKPEVANLFAGMKTAAKAIDGANRFVDLLNNPSLAKKFPAIATKLLKLGQLASFLGPAGAALGIGCDLLSAFGLVEDGVMAKLDEISRQIRDLRDDVRRGFEDLRGILGEVQVLLQFLPIYTRIQAQVEIFEQNVEGNYSDPMLFYSRFDALVEAYKPHEIVADLKQMHLLITGRGEEFGLPLFEQLTKGVKRFEGEEFDNSMANLFAQFQAAIALQLRAVRMLRSILVYKQQDMVFGIDVLQIFNDIATQRQLHPVQFFQWYLDFMQKGGRFEMKALRPDSYLYMEWGNHRVSGWSSDPGPKGKLNITPCDDDDGTFLITCDTYPGELMMLNDNSQAGDVMSGTDKTDKRGHWIFHTVNIDTRVFKLRTNNWEKQFVYMQNDMYTEIRGTSDVESCGDQAKFRLSPL